MSFICERKHAIGYTEKNFQRKGTDGTACVLVHQLWVGHFFPSHALFFLLSSSFTIFLGFLSFTTASTFPIRQELMLLEVLLPGSYLFRLLDVVNNPFTQREKPQFPLVGFVIIQPHILKTSLSSFKLAIYIIACESNSFPLKR